MSSDYIITTDCSSVHLAMELVVLGGGPSRGRVGTAVETSEDAETRPQLSGTSQPRNISLGIHVDIPRLSSCLYFDLKRDVKD